MLAMSSHIALLGSILRANGEIEEALNLLRDIGESDAKKSIVLLLDYVINRKK